APPTTSARPAGSSSAASHTGTSSATSTSAPKPPMAPMRRPLSRARKSRRLIPSPPPATSAAESYSGERVRVRGSHAVERLANFHLLLRLRRPVRSLIDPRLDQLDLRLRQRLKLLAALGLGHAGDLVVAFLGRAVQHPEQQAFIRLARYDCRAMLAALHRL